ncbi:hypothetical protein ACCO45_003997 [Purpureocillium lilacinum]|uniref:Uncharacterized protein n=1 Tax=Purpureocillium lilacinum TaxID=33203 RepID=A0ACC4E405_PURLI
MTDTPHAQQLLLASQVLSPNGDRCRMMAQRRGPTQRAPNPAVPGRPLTRVPHHAIGRSSLPLRRRKAKAAYPQGAASNERCAPGRQRHCRQRRRWADACHDNAAPGRGMSLPRTWKRVDSMGPAAAAAAAAPEPRKLLRYLHTACTPEKKGLRASRRAHTRAHTHRIGPVTYKLLSVYEVPDLRCCCCSTSASTPTYPLTSQPPSDDVPSPPRTSAPVPNERPLAAPEDGDPASHSAKPRPPRLPLCRCLAGLSAATWYIWRAPVGWAGGGELAGWREKEDASGPGNMPALPVKHPPKLVRDRSTSPIPKAVLFFVASKAIGFATRLPLCDSSHHGWKPLGLAQRFTAAGAGAGGGFLAPHSPGGDNLEAAPGGGLSLGRVPVGHVSRAVSLRNTGTEPCAGDEVPIPSLSRPSAALTKRRIAPLHRWAGSTAGGGTWRGPEVGFHSLPDQPLEAPASWSPVPWRALHPAVSVPACPQAEQAWNQPATLPAREAQQTDLMAAILPASQSFAVAHPGDATAQSNTHRTSARAANLAGTQQGKPPPMLACPPSPYGIWDGESRAAREGQFHYGGGLNDLLG